MSAHPTSNPAVGDASPWSVESWKSRLHAHQTVYPDRDAVDRAVARLHELPPLVTSWEIERLKGLLAEAQQGGRFLLQGGDCAEQTDLCKPEVVTNKLKILLQMSLVLVHASKAPVVRIARLAGQYAKPRSSDTETREIDGKEVSLPSYYGDLVNRVEFEDRARKPDPARMVEGYLHAGLTLNFIRSLADAGFADMHHPEYWELGFMRHAGLPGEVRAEYERTVRAVSEGLRFMEAVGERKVDDLTRTEFYTSHEGLNLLYESALTRRVPRRDGWYNLGTHLPWIGERTRALDGAHVEYFRGIQNPVGVKIGPKAQADEVIGLARTLNPADEPGKVVLITRMGVEHVGTRLGGLIRDVERARINVLWTCDPMHGNTRTTENGFKTRRFDDILSELEQAWDEHLKVGSRLGGVHLELTGDDVTECVGGASGLSEQDLERNYESPCDPRLNYEQAMEVALLLAKRMG